MDTTLKLQARISQGLTARLRFAVRLLQLSSLDYEQELHEIAARNPFLDIEARTDGVVALPVQVPESQAEPELGAPPERPSAHDAAADNSPDERPDPADPWLQAPGGVRDGARDAWSSPLDTMAVEVDLRAHLRGQAALLRLSATDRARVLALIESLDDDGYLRTPLDEIARLLADDLESDEGELATALKLVQSLDPAGVGARDVAECLRLQFDGVIAPDRQALAARIVAEQLERLARRDTAGIARALERSVAEIEALCAAIRRLDPRPARRFDHRHAHYIVPDVVVRKTRGRWEVQLNPAAVPRLQLNRSVADLFQRHRGAAHRELASHLQDAQWTVRNVEQRYATILAVAQSILKRQYGYFEHGPLAMKPLLLGEVAAEVGVHESTVCRVTNNKYMATPAGVIELKSFFSRPMALASGGASSGVAIRELVREMIGDEAGEEALSDNDIAQRLQRQGITITRRTVTKYRGILQLPSADQRNRARLESVGGDGYARAASARAGP